MPSVSFLLLRKKLLAWYLREARDLPWRRTRDPYAIWVSEIMLQQTQVDTVIPYYERWLKKFPDITALAKSPLEEVLSSWAGLGYYRRARMLHKASQVIVNDYGARIPNTAEELLKLPGIGRYTAGAIASIAFEEKTPVLDGNVIRILTRIFAVKGDTLKPAVLSELWTLAEKLLPEKFIGDFNQALMELGALICTPQNPSCTVCPVSKQCLAREEGKETFYPVKSRREKLEKIRNFAVVYRRNKEVWLSRQPEEARWGGLWMFPFWEEKASMMKALKNHDSSPGKWISIKHGFTKYLIDLEVYTCKEAGNKKGLPRTRQSEARWVNIAELSDYALPAPHRKIAQSLVKEHL